MKLSKIQLEALDSLLRLDNETDAPGYLGEYREPTRKRLRIAGLVDYELVETYTWGGAHRPRPRLYKLTLAGKQVVLRHRHEKAVGFAALMRN